MGTTSIWRASPPKTSFLPLAGEVSADVAILGGGITGVTLAALLADTGRSVVLLEAGALGCGSTGNSTGNLYEVLSHGLYRIGEKWDRDIMREVAKSRTDAIRFIERNVEQLNINCDFRRCSLYRYGTSSEALEIVRKEYQAAIWAGLACQLAENLQLPTGTATSLVLESQAQFNPLAYIQGLAANAASGGCRIFENSPVIAIDEDDHTLHTAQGKVIARHLVFASHTPKGVHLVHAEMTPYREYGIALQLGSGTYPQGIFWDEDADQHSLRSSRLGQRQHLIIIGADQKMGQHDGEQCLARLEDFARTTLDVASIDFHWSAQNYQSPDYLPYIGSISDSGIYIATGFAADGLTYGTLAAHIISDEILGRRNRSAELYKATRVAPLKAAAGILTENLNVAKSFIEDRITSPAALLSALPAGTGRIVEINGEKLAAYRDDSGKVSLLTPACTHLKCFVHWNNAERTWDCPCHGSRFSTEGDVIEGPAIAPLSKRSSTDLVE